MDKQIIRSGATKTSKSKRADFVMLNCLRLLNYYYGERSLLNSCINILSHTISKNVFCSDE